MKRFLQDQYKAIFKALSESSELLESGRHVQGLPGYR